MGKQKPVAPAKWGQLIRKAIQGSMGLDGMFARCGIGKVKGTASRWLSSNKFTGDDLVSLWEGLHPEITAFLTAAERPFAPPLDTAGRIRAAGFEVLDTRRPYTEGRQRREDDAYAAALAAVERAQNGMYKKMQTAEACAATRLFPAMHDRCAMASTTLTVRPLILARPGESEYSPAYFDSRVTAVRNGALFAFIMPTRDALRRLNDAYPLGVQENLADWDARWADMHARLAAAEGIGEEAAHRRVQCFKWDNFFPLTPPGWTVSLLVSRVSGAAVPRTVTRSRMTGQQTFALFPADPVTDGHLRSFVHKVLSNAATPDDLARDTRSWRGTFVNDFLHRIS